MPKLREGKPKSDNRVCAQHADVRDGSDYLMNNYPLEFSTGRVDRSGFNRLDLILNVLPSEQTLLQCQLGFSLLLFKY